MSTRTCKKCGEVKQIEEFYPYKVHNGVTYRRHICIECFKKGEIERKNTPEARKRQAELSKQHRDANPDKMMLTNAKSRAKRKGLEFNITLEDITIPEICPVLGIPLFREGKRYQDNSPSLDRIDNSKGYVKGNVIVVSQRANALKNDATIEELNKICSFYGDLLT